MVYITVMQSPSYRQMTLDELLSPSFHASPMISANITNTKTYEVEQVSQRFLKHIDITELISKLIAFNTAAESLRGRPRHELFRTFHIPKRSGGLRKIDAPEPELMTALRNLKTIFEVDFRALYHTSAFAYVKGRSTLDAVKRHQKNESKWFGKYDLSNFFGNTTLDFVMKQFSMVFPFSEVMKYATGRTEMEKALELAFLNGGLPQGTPISPLITNIIMIPIDFKLSNKLRNFDGHHFTYTRYADDFLISSRVGFDQASVGKFLSDTLAEFGAPFSFNHSKTRYGSSAGRNWNLGVMLNKDNEITVGHKKKRQFQSMLHNYLMNKRNGIEWDKHDVQVLDGYRSYYHMIEPAAIASIIEHISTKMGMNAIQLIKEDLR